MHCKKFTHSLFLFTHASLLMNLYWWGTWVHCAANMFSNSDISWRSYCIVVLALKRRRASANEETQEKLALSWCQGQSWKPSLLRLPFIPKSRLYRKWVSMAKPTCLRNGCPDLDGFCIVHHTYIVWENTAPGTELPRIFCAGIGRCSAALCLF